MTSLEIIKDELAKIEKDEDHILAGRQGNMIKYLSKALSVAVSSLEYYDKHESIIKEAYHSNEERQITVVHTFINHKATESLKSIANILSGGTVASLNEDKK